jgi:hypothetical protein
MIRFVGKPIFLRIPIRKPLIKTSSKTTFLDRDVIKAPPN